ncbi:BA14K family protein [Methylocella tundrae]|uniref:BA14K family protein n=1 Tax=Methylocella tundrae TaxID=227605 RepID=UPI0030FE1BD6|nr:BA14K family protein [Methylocella tundrae]
MRKSIVVTAALLCSAMLTPGDASARGGGHGGGRGGWHGGGVHGGGVHGGGWHGGGGRHYGGGGRYYGGGRRYYGGGGYYNGGNAAGAAIAGGILGLATGAIIAGSAANSAAASARVGDPNWLSYCARKYRSFDPSSGTYLAYDGNRYVCQ